MAEPLFAGVPNDRQDIIDPAGPGGIPSGRTVSRAWFAFFQVMFNRTIVTGTIVKYAGLTVPSGYLACNGTAVSRATFPVLNALAAAAAYASPWGAGDGTSTFNVPTVATVGGILSMIKT